MCHLGSFYSTGNNWTLCWCYTEPLDVTMLLVLFPTPAEHSVQCIVVFIMSYLTEGILVSHVSEAEFTQSSYTNGTSALLVNLYVFFIVLILELYSYVLKYNLTGYI